MRERKGVVAANPLSGGSFLEGVICCKPDISYGFGQDRRYTGCALYCLRRSRTQTAVAHSPVLTKKQARIFDWQHSLQALEYADFPWIACTNKQGPAHTRHHAARLRSGVPPFSLPGSGGHPRFHHPKEGYPRFNHPQWRSTPVFATR